LCFLHSDGLGFNNPATLAKLWAKEPLRFNDKCTPYWLKTSSEITNFKCNIPPDEAERLIKHVLFENMTHAIYTVSSASILGSVAIIVCINRFERKTALTQSFVLLAVVLAAASASFHALFEQGNKHTILIFFWVVISFIFSFGPNTLTFIVSGTWSHFQVDASQDSPSRSFLQSKATKCKC
jgi:PHS family inorganic phosphate transporter-like MFS transporter